MCLSPAGPESRQLHEGLLPSIPLFPLREVSKTYTSCCVAMTTKRGKWLQEHPHHDHKLPPSDECCANPQAVRLLCFCVDFFPCRWGVDSCSRASGIMWQPFMNVYGLRAATKTQTTNTEVVIQRWQRAAKEDGQARQEVVTRNSAFICMRSEVRAVVWNRFQLWESGVSH